MQKQKKPLKTKVLSIPLITYDSKAIAKSLGFAIAIVIFPAIFAHTNQNQWITGTIVNTILILAVINTGLLNSILIGCIPSFIALSRGLLQPSMVFMIPYIILGNAVLVSIFKAQPWKSLVLKIVTGSFAKFFVISVAAIYLVNIPKPLEMMMTWPQLVTALAGGLLAVGIQTFIKYKKSNNQS